MEVDDSIVEAWQQQDQELKTKNQQLALGIASSAYQANQGNLIEYQLETSELLGQLEHFLRGDYLIMGEEGEVWAKQTNKNLILFNDYGVNSIMAIIGNYLNKNTMLSRYDEMRINEIMADLGDELTIFVYCNYEKMGMDTQFKKTRFGTTILTVLHSIESSYRRALGGKTSEDINTSKIFTQSDMIGNRPMPMQMPKKKFHLLKPSTW